MGACVSKPWAINFKDILQRLRCMSACCYGTIVISHSELDGSVTENYEFCLLQDGEKGVWPALNLALLATLLWTHRYR